MADVGQSQDRKVYDFIVLGATGFTGKFVAKYIRSSAQCKGVRWAIAGRSQNKLNELIKDLELIESPEQLPDLLIADITDKESLVVALRKGNIVLNCTGPYRFLGETVVEACLEGDCNYLDICGEPQFMENCFLKYNKLAKDKNLMIIHACAFDSVPADLGALFVSRQYEANCCSSIESFLTILASKGLAGHYTTYECAVHGFGDVGTLKRIRTEIDKEYQLSPPEFVGPKLNKNRGAYFFEERLNKYAIPFMGADNSVVRSSQRVLAMNKGTKIWPQYCAYATIDGIYNVAATAVFGTMFSTLASFDYGRSVLLQYPGFFTNGIFSHEGPTTEQLANTSFEMHFFANGYTDASASVAGLVTPVDSPTPLAEAQEQTANSSTSADGGKTEAAAEEIVSIAQTPTEGTTCLAIKEALLGKTHVSSSSSTSSSSEAPLSLPSSSVAPNRLVHAVVKGAEPGYVATPAIFTSLALCVLREKSSLPCGVLTPAAAFYDSSSVYALLNECGLKFEVLKEQIVDHVIV